MYAENRKALDESDVRDLLRCLIGYLKTRAKSNDSYAIDCKYVGVLHKIFDEDVLDYRIATKEQKLAEKMLVNDALLKFKSPANKKPKFDNNERRELQAHTNSE